MRPEQREAIAKRLAALGVSAESFKAGTGGAALGKLMAERAGKLPQGVRPAGAGGSITLDKNWHGVHFLLCGAPEPGITLLSQVVMGGVEIGEDDNGYGPARYFDAARTAAIGAGARRRQSGGGDARALQSRADDRRRYLSLRMAAPAAWTG